MIFFAALLLQASAGSASADSRALYEPYRQCLLRQAPLLAAAQGENDSGLDQARSRCLSQNLSAGSAALFAEMRAGASQSEAGDRVEALRNQVEQEVLATVRADRTHAGPAYPAATPPPSGRALGPADVEVPDPIAPALTRYNRCVGERINAGGPLPADHPDLYRQRVDRAVAACAEIRASAMAEAERSLAQAPDYRDPGQRNLAIRHAFEGSDQVRRDFPGLRARGQLPGQTGPGTAPAGLVRQRMVSRLEIPDELAPAVLPYLNCLMVSNGVQVRSQRGVESAPPGISRGSDCTSVRRRAAIQGDLLLERRGMRNRGERRNRVGTVLTSIDGFASPRHIHPSTPAPHDEDRPDAEH